MVSKFLQYMVYIIIFFLTSGFCKYFGLIGVLLFVKCHGVPNRFNFNYLFYLRVIEVPKYKFFWGYIMYLMM